MDIEFVAAWGELFGGVGGVVAAAGVVVTLIYLARQVHQNTEQMRAQIAHDTMSALRTQFEPLKHRDQAELYYKGIRAFDSLTEVEKFQFQNISAGYWRVFEEAYLHHLAGRLEEDYWDSISGQLKLVLAIPGLREDWNQLGDNYNKRFLDYGTSLVPK